MKVCMRCGARYKRPDTVCPECQFAPEVQQGFMIFAPELLSSHDEYESEFFHALAEKEKGHFWFEARNQLLQHIFERFFADARNFLEIGCGTGFVLAGFSEKFPQLQLSGTDLFLEGMAYAQQRSPNATLFQMDARKIPFAEEFDVIGAFDVIEHIEEDALVLRQMYSALKPGGGVILTVPQHPFLWSYLDDYSHHKRRYTRHELRQKMEQAGFQVRYTTSFVALLLPAMVLARRQRKNDENFNVMAEFQMSSWLNAVQNRIMQVENLMTRMGMTFPMGGSLLMVGQKPKSA